jgi:hypothetical protein
VRWSDLLRDPRRLWTELGKVGLTIDDLVEAGEDDPELGPIMDNLTSEEAKQRLVLEWFGDQGHPQPKEPRKRVDPMYGSGKIVIVPLPPVWGYLPRLEDDEPALEQPHGPELRHRGAAWPKQAPAMFSWAKIQNAVRYFVDGYTRNDVAEKAKLPLHDATRVRKMWANGLLHLNEQGKLVTDPRVRTVKNKIALRYWDDQSGAWLDPNTSLS